MRLPLPIRLLILVLASMMANASASAGESSTAPDRRITITIDDLPWQRMANTPPHTLQTRHDTLIAQLKEGGVPVTGFVNEDKLEIDGAVAPERIAMLERWLDAGYALGNHTYRHVDLHAVGIPAYQDAILRGERELRPMLAKRGQSPRWFRHPYLRAAHRKTRPRSRSFSSSMATASRR
jgi:peptidoglycan/xylan/chitin deacetylase (PgdA/CDA1 family)